MPDPCFGHAGEGYDPHCRHCTARSAEQPATKIVMDGWGNLWHHFNDTGYLRLVVTTDPGKTLDQIIEQTGKVTAMSPADPTILLREQVQGHSV